MKSNFEVWSTLPDSIQALCKWHRWIIWDMRSTGNTEEYTDYQQMRLWLTETLRCLEVTSDMLPIVDEKNYMSIWFECDNLLNKQSLLDMQHEFYDLKKKYNGYSMVDLTPAS